MGEVCKELEVVTEEADTAEAGMEDAVEWVNGMRLVWTWFGFEYLVDEECEPGDLRFV